MCDVKYIFTQCYIIKLSNNISVPFFLLAQIIVTHCKYDPDILTFVLNMFDYIALFNILCSIYILVGIFGSDFVINRFENTLVIVFVN